MSKGKAHGAAAIRPHVYAFRIGDLIKVGRTKAPQTRMKTYRTQHPDSTLLGISAVFNAEQEEKVLMKLLGKPSKGREWFEYTPEKEEALREHFFLINPRFGLKSPFI